VSALKISTDPFEDRINLGDGAACCLQFAACCHALDTIEA
jgi:hypothetical protein